MNRRRFRLPSSSALLAFECAARHASFSRAAEELSTSQSAISRHIAQLEGRLETRLFRREGRRVELTEEGEHLRRTLVPALERLQNGLDALARWGDDDDLTIACTHELSHLFLMPRFEALRSAVGDEIPIRIMSYEYDALAASPDPRIDLMFSYERPEAAGDDVTPIMHEAVIPVCAPALRAASKLDASPASWTDVRLLRLTKQNQGWATWQDWFERTCAPRTPPPLVDFDNYVYLLEAAAAGRGIAIGWRGLIDRHLESGTLVTLGERYETFDRALHAQLTVRGRSRSAARRCLDFLRDGIGEAAPVPPRQGAPP